MRYELDDIEWKLVLDHRKHKAYLEELWARQESCEHTYFDTGYYSGETRYECSICKKVDWK